MPDKATHKTKAGAVAFVRYWVKILNFSWQHNSTRKLRQVSARNCGECTVVIKAIRKADRMGGYEHGGAWKPVAPYVIPLQPRDKPIVHTAIQIAKGSWRKAKNSKVHHFDATRKQVDFHLKWSANEWQMTEVAIQ